MKAISAPAPEFEVVIDRAMFAAATFAAAAVVTAGAANVWMLVGLIGLALFGRAGLAEASVDARSDDRKARRAMLVLVAAAATLDAWAGSPSTAAIGGYALVAGIWGPVSVLSVVALAAVVVAATRRSQSSVGLDGTPRDPDPIPATGWPLVVGRVVVAALFVAGASVALPAASLAVTAGLVVAIAAAPWLGAGPAVLIASPVLAAWSVMLAPGLGIVAPVPVACAAVAVVMVGANPTTPLARRFALAVAVSTVIGIVIFVSTPPVGSAWAFVRAGHGRAALVAVAALALGCAVSALSALSASPALLASQRDHDGDADVLAGDR